MSWKTDVFPDELHSPVPLAPSIILGIAFLRSYPSISTSGIALVVGYSLLKAPYMVMAVQSGFQSVDLQQLKEGEREGTCRHTRTAERRTAPAVTTTCRSPSPTASAGRHSRRAKPTATSRGRATRL